MLSPLLQGLLFHACALMFNLEHQRFVYKTNLWWGVITSYGVCVEFFQVKIYAKNPYENTFLSFSDSLRPNIVNKKITALNIKHYIKSKGSPPLKSAKFMRLSEKKYNATKKEFHLMQQESLFYFSNINWSNSLYVPLKKKSDNWRHFNDYRVLKNITISYQYLISFLTMQITFWRDQKFIHVWTWYIHLRKYLCMLLMFPK